MRTVPVRLRVVTLNVWGLPWPIGRDLCTRVEKVGDALPGLDVEIVAFQEVWIESVRDALIAAGQRAGFESNWSRTQAVGGSGLLVLSKLPISEAHFEPFQLGGFPERIDHADYYAGKGFVKLRVATAAGDVVIVATHLQAGYRKRALDHYIGHRTAQIVSLAASLRSTRDPVIVLGDFNFQDMYEEHAVLTGLASLRDVALELDQREDTILQSSPYREGRKSSSERVDFVFVRDGGGRVLRPIDATRVFAEHIVIDGREAAYSNHAGVRAELELIGGASEQTAPQAEALELARSLLTRGRHEAAQRRRDRRFLAAAGLAAAPITWAAHRSMRVDRRRFLARCCLATGVLAVGTGGASAWLAEGFGSDELEAYDAALHRLGVFASN